MNLFKEQGVKDFAAAASQIPVIDYGPYFAGEPGALDRLVPQVRHACEHIGFFYISGHGVPDAIVDDAFAAARRFHALPMDEKLTLQLNDWNIGYLPMNASVQGASTVHKATRPNQNESFFISHDRARRPPRRSPPRRALRGVQPVAGVAARHPRADGHLFRDARRDVRPHAAGLRGGARHAARHLRRALRQ